MDLPADPPNPPAIVQAQLQAAPRRDPAIAVQEEFDAAMRSGTAAALDLFIRRHPDSPLAAEARRALHKLRQSGR